MRSHTRGIPIQAAKKMTSQTFNKNLFGLLWLAGFVGELSTLWIDIPLDALPSGETLPFPLPVIRLLGLFQSLIILSAAVYLGVKLSPKVGLSAPFSEAITRGVSTPWRRLKEQLIPAIVGGFIGVGLNIAWFLLMKPSLPADFLAAADEVTLPLATRLLKGGIAEELVMRWGLMTLLVWLCWRFLQRQNGHRQKDQKRKDQKRKGKPKAAYVVIAIVISALVFGLLHLPAAALLSSQLTGFLALYIIFGNALFGLVAGYLYWKVGLESAILAHMLFHIVVVIIQTTSPLLSA